MTHRVLVADDSTTIQKVIKIAFARHPLEIVEASTLAEALSVCARRRPELLFIDATLPGTQGPQDVKKLRDDAGGVPTILFVGSYDAVDEGAFRAVGIHNILKKPFDSGSLVQLVEDLLQLSPLRREKQPSEVSTAAAPAYPGPPKHPTMYVSPPVPSPPPPPPPTDARAGFAVSESSAANRLVDSPGAYPPPPPKGPRAGMGASSPAVPPPVSAQHPADHGASLAYAPPPPPPPGFKGAASVHPPPPFPLSSYGETSFSVEPSLDLRVQESKSSSQTQRSPEAEVFGVPGPGMAPPIFGATDPFGNPLPKAPNGRPSQLPGLPDLPLDLSHLEDHDGGFVPPSELIPDEAPSSPTPPPFPGLSQPLVMDGARRGQKAFDAVDVSLLNHPGSEGASKSGSFPSTSVGITSSVLEDLTRDLPELVRRVVEDYCDRHFKSLAREFIASELRRLADEKARHLVDN